MIVALAILAAWRIAHLFAEETGPFRLGERWRNLWLKDDWIGEGMRCVLCLSFWLAVPASIVALWLDRTDPAAFWPLYWLGVAGGAAALHKAVTK